MRDIFLGDLSRLKLFDILKALLVEKKTGLLIIQGKDLGEIYLEAGNIIHSKASRRLRRRGFSDHHRMGAGKGDLQTGGFDQRENDLHPCRTASSQMVLQKTGVGEDEGGDPFIR